MFSKRRSIQINQSKNIMTARTFLFLTKMTSTRTQLSHTIEKQKKENFQIPIFSLCIQ